MVKVFCMCDLFQELNSNCVSVIQSQLLDIIIITNAVPVLSMPVWNRLFAWPVVMLPKFTTSA